MIKTLSGRVTAGLAVMAAGGLGVMAVQTPANASNFSAGYTCTVPGVGTQTTTMNGSLTASPKPATVGRSTHFAMHLSSLSTPAPFAINSWSTTTAISVSGAQTASFQLRSSGGAVPAGGTISADAAGDWTPARAGTDQFQSGNVTITMNTAAYGNITISCTANSPRPNAETLTVN
jgi:hypothetical protein